MIKNFKSKLAKDKHFSDLLKGSSISFIFKIIGMGLGYIFTLLVARWYGAETMGLYALSMTMLNIFVTLGVFGFDNALVKFVAEYNSQAKPYLVKEIYKKVLYIVVPVGVLLSAILYFGADFFANIVFKKEQLTLFLQITALGVLPFVLLRVNATLFQGLKKIKLFSFFSVFGVAFFSLIGLVVVSNFFVILNGSVVISVQVTSILILMLSSFMSIKKNTSIFRTISKNMLKYKDIIKVSFPMLLTSSMTLIMGWTDILMLGIFRSEVEVGIYSVIVKLAALTSLTLMVVNSIAAPKFSEFYSRGDMKGLEIMSQNSTKIIFFSSLPIIIVLLMFPKLILGIFGKEFIVGVVPLLILIAGQIVNAMTGSVGIILVMTGKQAVFNRVVIISSLLNIVLNYLLINKYGIEGAAYSTAISLIMLNITSFFLIKYYYGFFTIPLNIKLKKD